VIRERKEQLEALPNRSSTASADEGASVGECDENLFDEKWPYTTAQLKQFNRLSVNARTGLNMLVER
jgi:hypothetical protein